jgi:hypothetical protein
MFSSVSDGLHQSSKLRAINSAHNLNKDMGLLLFTRGIAATFNKIQKRMTINPIIIFSSAFIEFADYKTDITNFPLAKLPLASFTPIQSPI